MKLTEKQKKFCEEYLIDLNATQAAIRAGYSQKTADVIAVENLGKPSVKNYLSVLMEEKQKKRIATSDDVLLYLTSVLAGKSESEVLVSERVGDSTQMVPMMKHPDEKDRLRAAELLAKYHGLMAPQQVEVQNNVTVNIDQFNALVQTTRAMSKEEKEVYKMKLKEIIES